MGVALDKRSGNRRAQISHNGYLENLGTYASAKEAAKAWDAAAAGYGRTDLAFPQPHPPAAAAAGGVAIKTEPQ